MTTKLKVAVLAFILLAWPAFGQKTYQLSNLPTLNSNSLFITTIDAAGSGSRHTSFGQLSNQLATTFPKRTEMAGIVTSNTVSIIATNNAGGITNQIQQMFPLQIPVWTGIPNTTHPSVIRSNWPPSSVGTPHNYWLCHTPYPPGTDGLQGSPYRQGVEQPTIEASEDGIVWYTPPGLVNPIADYDPANSANFLWTNMPGVNNGDSGSHYSDGEIFIPPALGKMLCYYRANNGMDRPATSATSTTIGTGSKSFTLVQTSLGLYAGLRCRVYSTANNANYMEGNITAYAGVTLTVNVDTTSGSGTFTDWNVNNDLCYLVFKSSTNGINWSAATIVSTNIFNNSVLAPQIILWTNGIPRMYFGDTATSTMMFRDATDQYGTNWGLPTTSTSGISSWWHTDFQIKPNSSEVWCIASTTGGIEPYSNLQLYISANGTNFTLVSTNLNPRSGARFDQYGYYKPDFLFNSDGTIDLYAGASAGNQATNNGFWDGLNSHATDDSWKIGLFKGLTVQTNLGALGGPITSNYVAGGISENLSMVFDGGTTNWRVDINGDAWINRIRTRNLYAVDSIRSGAIYLNQFGVVTNALKITGFSGNASGLNGDVLWVGNTNTAGTGLTIFRLGGNGSGGNAWDRAFTMGVGSAYTTMYWTLGNSTTDHTMTLDLSDDTNGGKIAGFDIHATEATFDGTTLSWTGTATGNGKSITNISHITVNATGGTVGTVTAATGYQEETTYMSSGSTITSMTLALPTTTTMGQIFRLHAKSAVTTLSVTGTSFADAAVVTMIAGQTIGYQAYDGAGAYIRIE